MNYPFKITVYVYRRPNMRDEGLEMEMYMGMDFIRTCFDKMEVREDITSVNLSFPERWLNIVEQRSIYERAKKYCPNLKELVIKTHSVYIIQCTPNKHQSGSHGGSEVLIIHEGDGPLMQESVDGKLYFEGNVGGWIDPGKLTIL